MNIKHLYWLFFGLLLMGCKKADQTQPDYNRGKITVSADESFADVILALAEGYQINYPDAEIQVNAAREDIAFNQFLQRKTDVIVLANELDAQKQVLLKKALDIPYQPSKLAADAVLFIVPKNDPRNSISEEEVKTLLTSGQQSLIFTGNNTANLNFITSKFNIDPKNAQFSVIPDSHELIEKLSSYPGKIGVISQNAISRVHHPKILALREKIKILPVSKNGELISPENANLVNMKYPFTKILYFLEREPGFGMAKGFIRFSCTQKGQIIVEKEGLQPYNIYPRTVKFSH